MATRRKLRERFRKGLKKARGGFALLFSIIAAIALMLILLKIGLPGLSGSKDAGIRQSMLNDASAAVTAENLCFASIGKYVDSDLDNTGGTEAGKNPIDAQCPNDYIVASPGNHVTISTYQDNNGNDCFKVTVTNDKLTNIEAVYDSCDNTHASPYITQTQ